MDKKRRILVIDDDEQVSKMYATHLDFMGYHTECIKTGEDALATTLEFQPDLVLLDDTLNSISGLDVLASLKKNEQTTKIPVVMLSANSNTANIEQANKLGANEFLEKSTTDLPTIVNKIEEILKV